MNICHNLKIDNPYKASVGVSITEFNILFITFEKLYMPKTVDSYHLDNSLVLTDK